MAKALADKKIKVALITETAVYAVMSRINKIFVGSSIKKKIILFDFSLKLNLKKKKILGAQAIMNNGGMLCEAGGLLIATAAKSYSVPFMVLSGMYKLTPKFPLEQSSFNDIFNPAEIIEWTDDLKDEHIEILVDKFNYIGPEYISLYITDFGQHIPSQTYRLFSEYYGDEETKSYLKRILSNTIAE